MITEVIRRIYPTRFGQLHLRSHDGKGVPLVLLHMSPRSGAMWEALQMKLDRPTHAPDCLGYGCSDAPPRNLSVEQYAQATIEGLTAAGMQGPIVLLGVHAGSVEAIEIAHVLGPQVRKLALVGVPMFTAEEQQRQLEKYSEQPLRPATDGGHILGAWRGCFALRQAPHDLNEVHRRFIEHVVAANPGAALKAVAGYAIEKRLQSLQSALVVFAPHDDILEQTERVKPLLKDPANYIDLPDLGLDLFHVAVGQMAALIDRHLPAA